MIVDDAALNEAIDAAVRKAGGPATSSEIARAYRDLTGVPILPRTIRARLDANANLLRLERMRDGAGPFRYTRLRASRRDAP